MRLARAEGAKDGEDGGDDDPEPAARKPVNLLELAMRRRKDGFPPSPGEILDDGGFPGGGSGGARGRKPVPPVPPVGSSDPARRPPADSADEPDAEQARREALADEFVKEITKPLEAHRGDATTNKGNDIVARECKSILEKEFPDLLDKVEHVGGATKDGSGKERDKLSEIYLEKEGNKDRGLDPRQGSSHPDLTWEHTDGATVTQAHANTVTTNKDGRTPTAEERRSFDSLVEKVGAELATAIPKLRPGMDADEYREMAREKCRKIFGKLRDKLDKSGDEEPESDES